MPRPPTKSTEELVSLIRRWQESLGGGQPLSAQELCQGDTQKREQLRQQLEAVASMLSFLEVTDGDPQGGSQWQEQTRPDLTPESGGTAARPALPAPGVPGYEVIEEIGRGGMGRRLQGQADGAQATGRPQDGLAGGHTSPQNIQRFRVEAEAIARLQHPGIVQIHEVGEHEGTPFLSLEYVGGGSLVTRFAGTPKCRWPWT